MNMEMEKECRTCKKNGLTAKCSACIVTFKKMEFILRRKQELIAEINLKNLK